MPTPAPLQPQESSLTRLLVRQPVSSRHGGRWASQIAHLLGRQSHRVCSHTVQALAGRTATAKTVNIAYCRSPAAQLALLAIELRYDGVQSGGGLANVDQYFRVNVTATAPTGATWLDRGAPDSLLDGTVDIGLPSTVTAGRKWLTGLLDVSACSGSTFGDLSVEIVGVGAETHLGLATVHLIELPLGSLQPENSEPGLLLSWPDPRNWLEEGTSATGPRGLNALVQLEQLACTNLRHWWQIVGYEDPVPTTLLDTWFTSSAVLAGPNWRGAIAATANPTWRTRARAVYGTSAGQAITVRVRYLAASGGTVRVTMTPRGGAPSTIDVTCAASAAWTTATATGTLPASGTDQEVDIEITAKATAGDLYFSQVAVRQTEVA